MSKESYLWFLRRILRNMCILQFANCIHNSRKNNNNTVLGIWLKKRPCLPIYKKIGREAYPRPIEGIQAVTGRKIRGRCEPQSQILVHIILIYCFVCLYFKIIFRFAQVAFSIFFLTVSHLFKFYDIFCRSSARLLFYKY